jgi:hypothetical protein
MNGENATPLQQILIGSALVGVGLYLGIAAYRTLRDPEASDEPKLAMPQRYRANRTGEFYFLVAMAFGVAITLFCVGLLGFCRGVFRTLFDS